MFSTVIRCYNKFGEVIDGTIIDCSTRSGATRKGNTWLKDTFFIPTKKFDLGHYQYWNCYDVADIQIDITRLARNPR